MIHNIQNCMFRYMYMLTLNYKRPLYYQQMSLLGCTRGIWDMEAMAKHRQVGRIEQRDFVLFFN